MPTTFTRPTDDAGAVYDPAESTKPRKRPGFLSESANHTPQGRGSGATKVRWTEKYGAMRLNASVQAFLDNLETYEAERTDLSVVPKFTAGASAITVMITRVSDYHVVGNRFVFGLEIDFAQL